MSQPLTREERQAVLEISELLGINVHIGTPKTNQRQSQGYILNDATISLFGYILK